MKSESVGIGGHATRRFGDRHRVNLGGGGESLVEASGELIGDVFGNVLCAWVEGVEGRDSVEVVVGERVADFY